MGFRKWSDVWPVAGVRDVAGGCGGMANGADIYYFCLSFALD